jgi:two-component system OmpR family sensor kinase/two-component system sensor histidine kinase BaeS
MHRNNWRKMHPMPLLSRFRSKRGRRFFLFFFFVVIFGLIPMLIVGGISILALNPPFPWHPDPHVDMPKRPFALVFGVAAFLSMMAVFLSAWARRRVADPLAGVMEAAEKVTEGDLTARVEVRSGPFSNLQQTFNRMLVELETTDRQRRNLTADVAHELNTPLHIIQGYLEGIADGIYQADETTIEMLLDETRLLSRLVEDLRTLSLAESGELPLKQEEILLQELLDDIRTSFSGQSEEAQVVLEVDAPPDLKVYADPNRLDQVISNLVANALRHTPPRGRISIKGSSDQSLVCIEVEDTGEGIAPEDLPYIFNRFWRKDKSRERGESSGHGLGLAIAQQLVHAHGGVIQVESELEVGTKFIIKFPTLK